MNSSPRRAVVLCLAGSAFALVPFAAPAGAQTDQLPDRSFTVSGGVDGLYPGATATLDVTLTNPLPQEIIVEAVDVTVGDASAGCDASYVEVSPFRGSVRVPAEGHASVPLVVRMLPSAPDACQDARFALSFQGWAGQVPGTPAGTGADRGRSVVPSALARTGTDGIVTLAAVGASALGLGVALRRRASQRLGEVAP